MKTFLFLICFVLLSSQIWSARVALVVGDKNAPNAQILQKILKKQKHKVRLVSLKDESFPAQEIFDNYLETLAIRVVESNDEFSTMTLDEAEFWTEFLAARGSFALFADHLGSQEVYDSTLLPYAGLSLEKKTVQTTSLIGTQKDLIATGMTLPSSINGEVDVVVNSKGGTLEPIFQSQDGDLMAVKQQSCAFRLSYFSFLPTSITDFRKRDKWLVNTIDWNLGFALGVGMAAPDFPILKMDGEMTGFYNHMEESYAQILVVEFMASWCFYCANQLPIMVELAQWGQDKGVELQFVDYKESIEVVNTYLDKHPEITWSTVISDDGLGAKKFGVKGLPSIFILDANHKVRFIHKKGTSLEVLQQQISSLRRELNFNRLHLEN